MTLRIATASSVLHSPPSPLQHHRAITSRPPPTPQLHLYYKGAFYPTSSGETAKGQKQRCDIHLYREAVTSDEVLERIKQKETKKRGRKKGESK